MYTILRMLNAWVKIMGYLLLGALTLAFMAFVVYFMVAAWSPGALLPYTGPAVRYRLELTVALWLIGVPAAISAFSSAIDWLEDWKPLNL